MSFTPGSRLSQFQPGGSPRVSFEVFPARSTMQSDGMSELARTMARYQPEFVSVTYGAGGSSREATFGTIGQLLGNGGFPVVGHLTCAGQSRRRPTPSSNATRRKACREFWRCVATCQASPDRTSRIPKAMKTPPT
jgi:5,10-methylenetetrahydrofolate reductase